MAIAEEHDGGDEVGGELRIPTSNVIDAAGDGVEGFGDTVF